MHILLCNDDGYQARGIQILAKVLASHGHKITIVAPNDERSGQSHAMTFFLPVFVRQIQENTWAVQGTPADCAAIALRDLLVETPPDIVISGINHGFNLGMDVNYSGTVGAATEAALMGFKAMAVSADLSHTANNAEAKDEVFTHAAQCVAQLVAKSHEFTWAPLQVLNINHPGQTPKGVVGAHSRSRAIFHPTITRLTHPKDHDGKHKVFILGGQGRKSPREGTQEDVDLAQLGYITVSFLECRQSSTAQTEELSQVLNTLKL